MAPAPTPLTAPTGSWTQLNGELIGSQVPGSRCGASYEWEDWTAQPCATYYYVVEAEYDGGASIQSEPISATAFCAYSYLPAVLR